MTKVSKIAKLNIAYSRSWYAQVNSSYTTDDRPLTGTQGVVGKLTTATNINKSVLSTLIGISPTSPNWDKTIKDYYSSFYYLVPGVGKDLEIGFDYRNADHAKKFEDKRDKLFEEFLKEVEGKDLRGTEAKSIFSNYKDAVFALEMEKCTYDTTDNAPKYGSPIDPLQYIVWLVSLYSSKVAKRVIDLDKSTNVTFWLTDDLEMRKVNTTKFNLKKKAEALLYQLYTDIDEMEDVLYVFSGIKSYSSDVGDFVKLSVSEKEMMLDRICNKDHAGFVEVVENKNLSKRAHIERLIWYQILKRHESGLITLTSDPAVSLGYGIEDAISYMASEANKANVTLIEASFKGLVQKIKR